RPSVAVVRPIAHLRFVSRLRMVGSSLLRGTSTVVRLASIAAVLFVLAGLIGFLTDEVKDSSKVSPARISQITGGAPAPESVDISQPTPSAFVEHVREAEHTSAREFIDDVGDVLMSPAGWIDSGGRA